MNTRVATVGVAIIVLAVIAYYVAINRPQSSVMNTDVVSDDIKVNEDIGSKMPGTWQSTSDEKFVREFHTDGTVTDTYEGMEDATMQGAWTLFTSTNPDGAFRGTIEEGRTYLKIQDQNEALFFSVSRISDTELELIYLDRGGALNFTRVAQ